MHLQRRWYGLVYGVLFLVALVLLAPSAMPSRRAALAASAAPSVPPTACTLLSRPELEARVAVSLKNGQARSRAGSATACLFVERSGGRVVVLVRRIPSGPWLSEQGP